MWPDFFLGKNYWQFYPLETESDNITSLKTFVRDIGIPRHIHCDNAKTMNSKAWKKYISECETYQSFTEPNSPFQNRAETQIKMFKLMVITLMSKYLIPKRFWDYVGLYVCDIHNLTASAMLDYKTPKKVITGNTPDISEYTEFHLYQPCYYFNSADTFPNDKECLGRWLGVSHLVSQ